MIYLQPRRKRLDKRENPPLPHDHSKGTWQWKWVHGHQERKDKKIVFILTEYRCATEGCGFTQKVEWRRKS